jgi:hypothetical protein
LTDRRFSLSHNNPVSPNLQVLFPLALIDGGPGLASRRFAGVTTTCDVKPLVLVECAQFSKTYAYEAGLYMPPAPES